MVEVTLCILTYNEVAFIERCIKHHKPYVDYIVAVDGGSNDGTLEILTKFADKVMVEKEVKNDFAYLRNLLQELAPSDWCLHVDADELFNIRFLKQMKNIIMENKVLCFRFPRINVDQTYPQYEPGDWQVRLINKRFGVWVRPVHEIVWDKYGDRPLDQGGRFYVKSLTNYPIIHLQRPKQIREKILERWRNLSKAS